MLWLLLHECVYNARDLSVYNFLMCFADRVSRINQINTQILVEARHPRCVGSITKNFCVLHVQSDTTICYLLVQ